MYHRFRTSCDDFIKRDVRYGHTKERLFYSVVLQADSSDEMHRKFTRFLISAEAEIANETADVGVFDLQDDALTKFADNCANAIVETSMVSKEEIAVVWTSPLSPPTEGCILIR